MTNENDTSLPERIKRVVKAVAKRVAQEAAQLDFFAKFKTPESEIAFAIDVGHDTVWATYEQMANLFGTQAPAVMKHVANIFAEGELDREATTSKMEVVRPEGGRAVSRQLEHFNLDVILAVGYRVSGKKATEFRKWASSVLKGYIQDGYALNGKRLDSDPAALRKLAEEVRAIRTSEKNLYTQVRDTFKACSIDYDASSEEARRFYSMSQDKFHFAASEQTAAQIIFDRADGTKPGMGMTNLGNRAPTLADAKVAKNYCSKDELRAMEILGEQWLLYAEGMALRGKAVSMARLLNRLDALILTNEYPVFQSYSGVRVTRPQADDHVRRQLEVYRKLLPKSA